MTMDLEEMKQAWTQLQARVERLERIEHGGRGGPAGRVRDALRGTWRRDWITIGVWGVFALWAGSFWFDHREVPHLLIAGLALHGYAIATIILGAIQLRALAAIDYGAPIVALQRQLAGLARLRARCSLALGLPWWLLWVPLMIVGITWLTGVDFYDPAWAWSSLGIGVIGLVVSLVVARGLAARPVRSPTLRRMIDDLSGRSLARAMHELDEIDEFTRNG
jgi:hypothetical protein